MVLLVLVDEPIRLLAVFEPSAIPIWGHHMKLVQLAAYTTTLLILFSPNVDAQITAPRTLSTEIDPVARLEEQLVNRLRATTAGQQAYVRRVVKLVDENRLDLQLIVAIERYALRRNPQFALPFFERALKFEAGKRGVSVPSIRFFTSTAAPGPR